MDNANSDVNYFNPNDSIKISSHYNHALPTIIKEYELALEKSNSNIQELKDHICDLIQNQNRLKERIYELEQQNLQSLKYEKANDCKEKDSTNVLMSSFKQKYDVEELKNKKENLQDEIYYLQRESIEKDKIIEEKNEIILSLKKTLKSINNAITFRKLSPQEDFAQTGFSYSSEKSMGQNCTDYSHTRDLVIIEKDHEKSLNRELTLELEKLKINEKKNIREKEKMKKKIKQYKEDLKVELNEKINILKELEKLSTNQIEVLESQGEFRHLAELNYLKNEKQTAQMRQLEKENNLITSDYKELFSKYEDLKKEYDKQHEEYENANVNLKGKGHMACDSESEEVAFAKAEVNLWKYALVEMIKHRLIRYDLRLFEDMINVDKKLVENSPKELKEPVDYAIAYFRRIYDEENAEFGDCISIKQALLTERERICELFSNYSNEIKLRRKIHNRYMTMRGNMRIMCRLRPLLQSENTSSNRKAFSESIKAFNDMVTISHDKKERKYEMDYIFNHRATQQEVYDEVSMLVQNLIRETNICVIAYGQTCTGKTYTIEGPRISNPGVVVRAAREIFELANDFKEKNFQIALSIIEIYNENIYNLLDEGTPMLSIYEGASGSLNIPDLTPISIKTYEEAVKLFQLGKQLRVTSHNLYHERSSRSHCIYTFYIKFSDDNKTKRSKMHFVDLAGSERISKAIGSIDETIKKEAVAINLSLNSLSNVLNAISIKQNHIPYRDSKLTHFLKESLNENFNILLMLHISPNIKDIPETISTLEFGSRIGRLCKYKPGKEKTIQRTSSCAQKNNLSVVKI